MRMSDQPVDRPRQDGIEDLGYARLDTDREARTGDPEVVYGAGKTPDQVVGILQALHEAHPERAVLATRLTDPVVDAVLAEVPGAVLHETARAVTVVNIDNGFGAGVFAARVARAAG